MPVLATYMRNYSGSMIQSMRYSRQAGIILVTILGGHLAVFAQSELHMSSLCSIEKSAREGSRNTVRVSGVFSDGFELGVLTDPAGSAQVGTWVELSLRLQHNKQKLRRQIEQSRSAVVVFVGEFYGPPVPGSRLPEAIRKDYHPGWGHLGAFRTKLVVTAIESVQPAPAVSQVPDGG